jgi:hypothetical protein
LNLFVGEGRQRRPALPCCGGKWRKYRRCRESGGRNVVGHMGQRGEGWNADNTTSLLSFIFGLTADVRWGRVTLATFDRRWRSAMSDTNRRMMLPFCRTMIINDTNVLRITYIK